MAATLKMCFMVHIEDSQEWVNPNLSASSSQKFARLATMVGTAVADDPSPGVPQLAAKISFQFGRNYLDKDAGSDFVYDPTVPTSLSWILDNGGNFWVHCHCATYPFLRSTYHTVQSAYENEKSVLGGYSKPGNPAGRSGGWATGFNWVSISAHAGAQLGVKVMNSPVMLSHIEVPQTLRPYRFTDDELSALYHHHGQPGPLDTDVSTARARPFYMRLASDWTNQVAPANLRGLATIYPLTSVDSVMMIPHPGQRELAGLSKGRSAYSIDTLTQEDCAAALTQVYSTYQQMNLYQSSITNVWYVHVGPSHIIHDDVMQRLQDLVFSINHIMEVGSPTPKGQWANMNEIASFFSDSTSKFY